MRRFALALLIAFASPILMGAGKPAPHHFDLSEADANELDAVSAYLNGITTLKGGFLQIEPSGSVTEGTFYISKPGKMRFDYQPPSATLIVSDGHTVAVANTRLNTVDRYPLWETPLGVVLSDTIDLRHDSGLVGVAHLDGMFVVYLRTSQTRAKANISLSFTEPQVELREWSVIDNQGQTTTVALRNQQPGAALSPSLFILPEKRAASQRREN